MISEKEVVLAMQILIQALNEQPNSHIMKSDLTLDGRHYVIEVKELKK